MVLRYRTVGATKISNIDKNNNSLIRKSTLCPYTTLAYISNEKIHNDLHHPTVKQTNISQCKYFISIHIQLLSISHSHSPSLRRLKRSWRRYFLRFSLVHLPLLTKKWLGVPVMAVFYSNHSMCLFLFYIQSQLLIV